MDGDVLQALVVASIPAIVLWRGFRRVSVADVQVWAARFGGGVGPAFVDATRARLERGRRYRAIGAAIGLVVAGGPAYVNLIDPTRSADFTGPALGLAWVYGAAVGAGVAEATLVQQPARPGVARIERRRWQDHVSPAPLAVAVASAVVAAAFATVGDSGDRAQAVAASIAALASCALLALGLRRIVDRARVGPDDGIAALDDALRADGAHHLAGAAVAATGSSAASLAIDALPHGGWWAVVALGLGAVHYASVYAWWYLAREATWTAPARAIPA